MSAVSLHTTGLSLCADFKIAYLPSGVISDDVIKCRREHAAPEAAFCLTSCFYFYFQKENPPNFTSWTIKCHQSCKYHSLTCCRSQFRLVPVSPTSHYIPLICCVSVRGLNLCLICVIGAERGAASPAASCLSRSGARRPGRRWHLASSSSTVVCSCLVPDDNEPEENKLHSSQ